MAGKGVMMFNVRLFEFAAKYGSLNPSSTTDIAESDSWRSLREELGRCILCVLHERESFLLVAFEANVVELT